MSGDQTSSLATGFLVVRKPDRMSEELTASDGPEPKYRGMDRMPWWDLAGRFYTGTLIEPLCTRWRHLESVNTDRTGLVICREFNIAEELLAASNTSEPRNELIAVDSERLRSIKGTVSLPAQATFLGFDVFVFGYWSLLKDGFHKAPSLFPHWNGMVNEFGLLPTPKTASEYNADYKRATTTGLVEDIPVVAYDIEVISVWSLPMGHHQVGDSPSWHDNLFAPQLH